MNYETAEIADNSEKPFHKSIRVRTTEDLLYLTCQLYGLVVGASIIRSLSG